MAWTQLAHDDFTGSNDDPLDGHTPNQGAAWVEENGDWALTGTNRVKQNTGGATEFVARNSTVLGNDQAVEATLHDSDSTPFGGIALRVTGTNGYRCMVGPLTANVGTLYIALIGGAVVDSQIVTYVQGDVLRFEAVGTLLTAFINAVQVAQGTDATYANGSSALYQFSSVGAQFGNFYAYEQVSGPVIDSVTPDTFTDAQSGIVIAGSNL